jgi:transcriptional accessory protein Tex/SPT6
LDRVGVTPDPRKIAKPGDVVCVKVLEVDTKRRRIALTMWLDEAPEAPVPRTAGGSTMAYDALRTIMPIAGWPEERAREVQINVSGTLGPRFAHDSPLEGSRIRTVGTA